MPVAEVRTEMKEPILVIPPQLSISVLGKLMNLSAPHFPHPEFGHFSCKNYFFPGININTMPNLSTHSQNS